MSARPRDHTELPIPNGWFAVAFSNELVPGEVRRIHYFDEDLVLYRGRALIGDSSGGTRPWRLPGNGPQRGHGAGARSPRGEPS